MARLSISSFRGEQFSLSGSVVRGGAVLTADAILPSAVLHVDSTAGYPGAGTLIVAGQQLAYTGVTATSFTGVTGGVGTVPSGSLVQAAVDLRGGVALAFTAKRTRGGAAVVTKTIADGITVSGAAPGDAYTIAIAAADTNAFTKAEDLLWELRMTEAGGDVTVVAYGDWRVGLGAS